MRAVTTFFYPLFIVVTVGIFGFAASISVKNVKTVGSGSATVKAPDTKITSVTWNLQATDSSRVDKVKLTWENFIYPPFIEPSWYRFYVSVGGEKAKGRIKVKAVAAVNELLKVDGNVEYAKVISLEGSKPNKIELVIDLPSNPLLDAIADIVVTVLKDG